MGRTFRFRYNTTLLLHICLIAPIVASEQALSADVAQETQQLPPVTSNPDALTLDTALAWALERNPGLAAFSWELRAAEARQLQAGLRPNPELAIEIEDIGLGSGVSTRTVEDSASLGWGGGGLAPSAARSWRRESDGNGGFSEAEYTLALSQLIELGGKRAQRLRVAGRDRDVAAWDYEIARASVLAATASAFNRVLATQRQLVIAGELVALATRFGDSVQALVEAGKVAPLDGRRFSTELRATQILFENIRHETEAARAALAACWGDERPLFEHAAGDLPPPRDLPPLDALIARTGANPDLKRWMAETVRRETVVALEQAQAVPDLTLGLGIKFQRLQGHGSRAIELDTGGVSFSRERTGLDERWSTSLVLEAAVPLPVFNRNQGNIKEAQAHAAAGAERYRQARLDTVAALTKAYHEAAARTKEFRVLDEEIVPGAESVFTLTEEGYRQGKFSYLDVLEAERTLADARIRREAALQESHEKRIAIEQLTGSILDTFVDAALTHK